MPAISFQQVGFCLFFHGKCPFSLIGKKNLAIFVNTYRREAFGAKILLKESCILTVIGFQLYQSISFLTALISFSLWLSSNKKSSQLVKLLENLSSVKSYAFKSRFVQKSLRSQSHLKTKW